MSLNLRNCLFYVHCIVCSWSYGKTCFLQKDVVVSVIFVVGGVVVDVVVGVVDVVVVGGPALLSPMAMLAMPAEGQQRHQQQQQH